jgi:uncharacterized protein YeaC (DUF1315 family)
MGERLMAKLDRLGAEAGIKQMTPEIYRFSMLVRADVVAQWPQREWVDLTEDQIKVIEEMALTKQWAIRMTIAQLKECNT